MNNEARVSGNITPLNHWCLCSLLLPVTSSDLCYTCTSSPLMKIPVIPRSERVSEWVKWAWNVHTNAQRKLAGKFSSTMLAALLCGKNNLSWWCILGNSWIRSKPSWSLITPAKNERWKEKWKNERLKDRSLSYKFWYIPLPEKNPLKCLAGGKNGVLSWCKCLF